MKILIIKPSSFGDIIQALPCANALKEAYPGCFISWVVFNQWQDLPKLCSDIDEVIFWDRKNGLNGFFEVLGKVRATDFDLIIDLQGLLRSAFLAKFAKGKVKLGVPGMKELSNLLIKEVYPQNALMNATLRNLEPLRFLTGKKYEPKINITPDETLFKQFEPQLGKDFISFLPFARGKGKDWSLENYYELTDMFAEKYPDTKIAVLGSLGDFGKFQHNKITDLCGATDISSLAAVLSKSFLAVGADTGPMHLASVLQTPSVFIFGASDINETAPYIGKFSLLINKENPADIDKVTPTEVFAEIEKWKK
ncbi:glycosyltransferase family 9 protein [Endomicrobium proavitum]|uniref:Lipopolysaccharide heptosyltransferase I n=1 Tax=Endomicrobium proavitum TaxID=1408281 RepID=A0A0G3WJ60_9BACT|nr:glycosyltransferase family 9 protein [Endomicrobium proavitum]AKL97922.1 lipopolysaccharide heptosyltransferase I [Endomicrobium proavitum]